MTRWDEALLMNEQAAFVVEQLGAPVLVADLSWNLVDTKVLHVRASGRDLVVKAAPLSNHHIAREISAHRTYTEPLVKVLRTGRLVAASSALNLLILSYLPGTLVQGSPAEWNAACYTQAGSTLAVFHDQHERVDAGYEARMTEKTMGVLGREHRIAADAERTARLILASYRPAPVVVVPTHGDWQPRNWLYDDDRLHVIDFGRFDLRPATSDFCRLATQQWRVDPLLEKAFFAGYGADTRSEEVWRIELLREAIGTAVWAFLVGDVVFEAQGHRMLDEALARF